MKKVFLMAAVVGFFLTIGVSAHDRFTVQIVTGNVEKEISSGTWGPVKAGDVLAADTVIRTRLNSSLVIKRGDRTSTIGAMQRGALKDLETGRTAGGIKIEGSVAETDTARRTAASGSSSTAAARADAVDDAEIILQEE
jgi:hypothetical protein